MSRTSSPRTARARRRRRCSKGPTGVLLVDGYSGYNVVDEVSTRRRAACHAHLRRYFHEALPTAPVAQEMLDLVAELYRRRARRRRAGLVGRRKVGVSETARRPDPRAHAGVARRAARASSAQEPHRRRDPLRRQPVGRARRLPRRRARAARQQRLGARAPPRRARPEELPLRPRRRRAARASRACTRSWRRARRAGSIPSSTSPTSSLACRITRPAPSTSCCPAPGLLRAMTSEPRGPRSQLKAAASQFVLGNPNAHALSQHAVDHGQRQSVIVDDERRFCPVVVWNV